MLIKANEVLELLKPHCKRIEIAGSIRRKRPMASDIELVIIPKPYDLGIFESGIATVINKWEKAKGELTLKTRYTQRLLEDGTKVDIFFAVPSNWGYVFLIRTGSAEYSKMIATTWRTLGYYGKDGFLYDERSKKIIKLHEERELFSLLQMDYTEPENRET